MKTLIILSIYIIEVIKYQLAFCIVYKEKIQRRWSYYVGGATIFFYMILAGGNAVSDYIATYFCVLFAVFVSVNGNVKEKLKKVFLLLILILSMDKIITRILHHIKIILHHVPNIRYGINLFNSIWGLAVLGILFLFYQKKKKDLLLCRNKVMLFIIISGMIIVATITSLGLNSNTVTNIYFRCFADVLVSAAYLGICLLFWFLLYLEEQEEHEKRKLEQEEEFIQAQKNYYHTLLQKEEDTRKFRHDIENHIFCLNELAQKDHMEELKSYLENLSTQMEQIRNISYTTGNELVDIVLNDKLAHCNEGSRIEISGGFEQDLNLSEMDLCTIFSNLFQNAVDELNCQEAGGFQFHILTGRQYTEILLRNSVREPVILQNNGLPQTKKSDLGNHGLGLQNVKTAVERNGGSFQIVSREDRFEIKIQLHNFIHV